MVEVEKLNPKQMLQAYLMASYAYYICFRSVMRDEEFDRLCKLLLESWDSFEHQHKHLVAPEDLKAGTAFKLRRQDYPLMVVCAAELWMSEGETGKMAGD